MERANTWCSARLTVSVCCKTAKKSHRALLRSPCLPQEGGGKWRIDVTLRSRAEVCSSSKSPLPLGDRAVINADTIARSVP